jgi:hypothetical protein
MASPTRVSKARRRIKKAGRGKFRKNLLARTGTTAKNLPLNVPNANEQKQKKASAKA